MRLTTLLRTVLVGTLTISSLLTPVAAHAAAGGSIYFERNTFTASGGSNVRLPIIVDGNTDSVDTVSVVVSFPADKLTFVGLDNANTFFDIVEPSAPKADSDGTVRFSVASTRNSTSSQALVTNVLFKSLSGTGSARVGLLGSEGAAHGRLLPLDASSALITSGPGDGSAKALSISRIKVDNITSDSGIITWHTDAPTNGTVDYGANIGYGFVATNPEATTEHRVQLASLFSGKTDVHFRITSVSANGEVGVSDDKIFTTKGYTVDIAVKDKVGKPIVGAKVRVGNSAAVESDGNGIASVQDVGSGNQKTYINDAAAQIITVKEVTGQKGTAHQNFSLVAERKNAFGSTGLLALLFVVLAGVLYWAWRQCKLVPPPTS